MREKYRIIDRLQNKLLLKTDDYASVLIFVNKHMSFDYKRHIITYGKRQMSLEEVYTIRKKLGDKARIINIEEKDLKVNKSEKSTKKLVEEKRREYEEKKKQNEDEIDKLLEHIDDDI